MYIPLTKFEVSLIDNILQDYDLTFDVHLAAKVRDFDKNVALYQTCHSNLLFLKTVVVLRAIDPQYSDIYKIISGTLYPKDILEQKTLDYYAKCFADRSC